MRSFFRYPGGKYKLMPQILKEITPRIAGKEYREPFFGGGSVGINVMKELSPTKVWINDFDLSLSDLWSMVINNPDALKAAVEVYVPTVEDFFAFKDFLTNHPNDLDADERAFMKLAIHQMSYSGLGTMAGGPIGGKSQTSKYPVGCRWSPKNICKQIDRINKLFSHSTVHGGECTNLDCVKLIEEPGDAFIYLDPPYYDQGEKLYQHGFGVHQHIRMRDSLKTSEHSWVLSYDDCPEVIKLYDGWADIYRIDNVNYSITVTRDKDTGETRSRNKSELLILSR